MLGEYGLDREKIEDIYDTIIIGGGIVGAGVFREHSLHGLKSLLLDQADFNSQTSQGSSKMLHGGIRYLENMDFALVFEALKEKNLWLKLTPHVSKEVPFYLPIYKESKWPLPFLRIGLFLYDLLSLFKNSSHKVYNKKNTLKAIPGLKSDGLRGSGMYFDGIVDDSKLGLECIYDALNNPNCQALNYKKVIKLIKNNDHYEVTYQDVLSGEEEIKFSKSVVMATGPFTDQVMNKLNIPWDNLILPSKGTHLWLKKDALAIKDAMVLQTADMRIIFVIPQRNAILVGTTETPLDPNEEFLDIQPTEEEITYLLESVNEYFPTSNVGKDAILSSFSAVRPLVRAGTSSSKTSRTHKVLEPQENLFVIVGGKYTTFRRMAFDVNKKLFKSLGIKHQKDITLRPLRTTSIVKDPFGQKITQANIQDVIDNEMVRTREDLISRRLSFPSTRHLNNDELSNMLDNVDLKSIPKSK